MLSYDDASSESDTTACISAWVSLSENAALGTHTLILEGCPEVPDVDPTISSKAIQVLPDSTRQGLPKLNRAGPGSSNSDEEGDIIEGMYAQGRPSYVRSRIPGR
jgi:hypothetical protein